ncbi:MAG: sulfotransferase domain-containing protein [Rhizobiales bacterium]|nr:sulfotransferase domain-containing protein [Hyphomicrobiales bacterium]
MHPPDYDKYHGAFGGDHGNRLRGEATPIYMYWPQSICRLRTYNPRAKLIILLRHPTLRAYSHWRMESVRNCDSYPFELAISQFGRARMKGFPDRVHRVFSYIERGFYAEQIRRVLQFFARPQVHFFRTDQLWNKPQESLQGIEHFLGIGSNSNAQPYKEYIVPVDSRALGPLAPATRSLLDDMFKPDIRMTAELTGLELDDWLSPGYSEPMPSDILPAASVRAA